MRYIFAFIAALLPAVCDAGSCCTNLGRSIRNLGHAELGFANYSNVTPSMGTCALSAAGDECAVILKSPKATTVKTVLVCFGTVTTGATSSGLDVRVETLNTGSGQGDPSGTLWDTTTNGALIVQDADDNTCLTVAMTSAASLAAGDEFAVTIVRGDSANLNINQRVVLSSSTTVSRFPYADRETGAAWTKANGPVILGLKDSNGTPIEMIDVVPLMTIAAPAYTTATTPDEGGNLVSFPSPMKICAVNFGGTPVANGGYQLVIYDGADNALLTTTRDHDVSIVSAGRQAVPLAGEWNVSPYAKYRVVIKPTAAVNMSVQDFATLDATWMPGFPLGAWMQYTSRTDAGAWSDTATKLIPMSFSLCGT